MLQDVPPPSWDDQRRDEAPKEERAQDRVPAAAASAELGDHLDSAVESLLPGEAYKNTNGIDNALDDLVHALACGLHVLDDIEGEYRDERQHRQDASEKHAHGN